MKTAILLLILAVLTLNSACNRFEAKHEQLPEEERQGIRDKTDVEQRQDTLPSISGDSLVR